MEGNSKLKILKEGEIQYSTDLPGLKRIRDWLLANGGYATKNQTDRNWYYDTKNNRLLREGVECRVKPCKKHYRYDLKTPFNTESPKVAADEYGVLWRWELQSRGKTSTPDLWDFKQVDLLKPVAGRVKKLFNKQLHPKFVMVFDKYKIEREIEDQKNGTRGRIEYALQTGHFETPEGERCSDTWHIVELELKKGDIGVLHAAKKELTEQFSTKLHDLDERKLIQGFRAVAGRMSGKERRKFYAFLNAP